MSIRVYFLLLAFCLMVGKSHQQIRKLEKRMSRLEATVGGINIRTQMDISGLHDAVQMLQNISEGNSPCITEVSPIDETAVTHLKSDMKDQDIKLTAIHRAVSDEKVYARERTKKINEIESGLKESGNMNKKLTEHVQEITTDLLKTDVTLKEDIEQMNNSLTEELQVVRAELIHTKQLNDNLTVKFHEVTKELMRMNVTKNKQLEKNKDELLGLKLDIVEIRQKLAEISSVTTTKQQTTTEQTTTEPTTTTTTVTVPIVLHPCPYDWNKFHNTCYLYVWTRVSWDDAKTRCADQGAILAEPDTREKHQFLIQMIRKLTNGWHIWIGGTDRQTEGSWTWAGSGRPIVSPPWARGQPDSRRDDCLVMYKYGWYVMHCSNARPYMCQKQTTV